MPERDPRPPRQPRRRVDGVLLLDKPRGLSSNAALQCVKRAYRAEKAGHTGTLDPLADGLLPICLGEATKFSSGLLDAPKAYRAVLCLGVTTETGDAEGAVLAERPVGFGLEQIAPVLERFRGPQMQVPHRYSAIKRAGRAAYDYARAGDVLEIAPRPVTILELVVAGWVPPLLTLDVRCSKGTYIRSLAEDIGEALGCGAHVASLRRTAVAGFGIDGAFTLEAIEAADEAGRDAMLRPLEVLVAGLPRVLLEPAVALRFRHGQPAPAGEAELLQDAVAVAVHQRGGAFLGLAVVQRTAAGTMLAPSRLLASPEAVAEQDGSGLPRN